MNMNPAELAELLNSLRWWTAILVVVLLVTWRLFAFFDKRAEAREKRAMEEVKNARAQQYAGALCTVADAMGTLKVETIKSLGAVQRDLNKAANSMGDVRRSVQILADRQSGVMPFDESVRIYETLLSGIKREAQVIAEESLRDNHYADRPAFIKRKVCTSLAKIVQTGRTTALRLSVLSIPPESVFRSYIHQETDAIAINDTGSGGYQTGERFHLCDTLWHAIERCHTVSAESGVKAAIDEAKVRIENTVADYLAAVVQKARREIVESTRRALVDGKPLPRTPSGEWSPHPT